MYQALHKRLHLRCYKQGGNNGKKVRNAPGAQPDHDEVADKSHVHCDYCKGNNNSCDCAHDKRKKNFFFHHYNFSFFLVTADEFLPGLVFFSHKRPDD